MSEDEEYSADVLADYRFVGEESQGPQENVGDNESSKGKVTPSASTISSICHCSCRFSQAGNLFGIHTAVSIQRLIFLQNWMLSLSLLLDTCR